MIFPYEYTENRTDFPLTPENSGSRKMSSELIINSRSYETRVALVENGVVVELHIERDSGRELMGNIYRGRVVRVLPGMQAAFVDISLGRTAFLYVSDVYRDFSDFEQMMLNASEAEWNPGYGDN
jgi:ribonuclease G